jgi:2-polyprenyl-3-methyl-5-hydroxy-6-metoxy-1,4-benzoquinol methylase
MSETVTRCPLCENHRSLSFDRREVRGYLVEYRLCRDCGLVFQSPRMTEGESAAFYTKEYRLLQEGSTGPTAQNIKAQQKRVKALVDFARPVIPKVTRHLDIGCSLGILLQYFQTEYHNQAMGVEPGEAHRDQARKEGLTVYATMDDLEKAREARFDMISMSHVLEHLPDPVGTLTHLREALLTADGRLLLEVPNLYAHDSFEVAHLIAFSPHTLQEVLRRSGFIIDKFEQHGRPNSQILPLFLTVLCHPTGQPDRCSIHAERRVRIKRRISMLCRRMLEIIFPKRAWSGQG